VYWSGTQYSANPNGAWSFYTNAGYQYLNNKDYGGGFALAVSPGQISAVPLPGAAWLLGSGLLGLVGLARRKADTLALR